MKQVWKDCNMVKVTPNLYYNPTTILGKGSHGVRVYQGRYYGRLVAVKRILRDYKLFVKCEKRILRLLGYHPNIIKLLAVEKSKDCFYIVLELCNFDLNEFIRLGCLNIYNVKDILRQLVAAVVKLHQLNIIHRDIRPHNILLQGPNDERYIVKLADFGISAKLEYDQEIKVMPFTVNRRIGMGPDMPQKSSKKSDILALGAVFYYVLNNGNTSPFLDNTNIPQNLIARMMDPAPELRPTIHEVLNDDYFK